MTSTIGIPIKLLNEAQGHIVTLEITSGQTYRGKLLEGKTAPCAARHDGQVTDKAQPRTT